MPPTQNGGSKVTRRSPANSAVAEHHRYCDDQPAKRVGERAVGRWQPVGVAQVKVNLGDATRRNIARNTFGTVGGPSSRQGPRARGGSRVVSGSVSERRRNGVDERPAAGAVTLTSVVRAGGRNGPSFNVTEPPPEWAVEGTRRRQAVRSCCTPLLAMTRPRRRSVSASVRAIATVEF